MRAGRDAEFGVSQACKATTLGPRHTNPSGSRDGGFQRVSGGKPKAGFLHTDDFSDRSSGPSDGLTMSIDTCQAASVAGYPFDHQLGAGSLSEFRWNRVGGSVRMGVREAMLFAGFRFA
jgi:hypothetical protein